MMTFDQAKGKFGSVVFAGVEYAMTSHADATNRGTEGEVVYVASAIVADGAEYRVVWETTKEWDASCAIAGAEARGEDIDREALGVDSEFVPCDVYDESLACDWDNPIEVRMA